MLNGYFDWFTNRYGYGSGTDLLAVFVLVIIIALIIALPFVIMDLIGSWKTIKKGGEPGWGALIPFYREYLLCKITGVSPWWVLIVFLGMIISRITIIGPLACLVAIIYFLILLSVSLSRSFGKSDAFAIGLILLNPIFMLILGITGEYQGPKPMEDIIFKNKGSTTNSAMPDGNQQPIRFCTNCGQPLNDDAKFCTSCGKQIV